MFEANLAVYSVSVEVVPCLATFAQLSVEGCAELSKMTHLLKSWSGMIYSIVDIGMFLITVWYLAQEMHKREEEEQRNHCLLTFSFIKLP